MFKGYVYDGLWTLALAIDDIAKRYKTIYGTIWSPNDIHEHNSTSASLIRALTNTSFIGVTVRLINII